MEKIEFEDKLLEAIKKDDLKSFSLLMPTNSDLNLCFGRFPILSLLYLYSSFKILSKFEKVLMPIHNFKFVDERLELYKTFKKKAGRAIRFFSSEEIIYPVLMLGVLNEKTILKHNLKFLYKNAEIDKKLLKIYNLKYDLIFDYREDKIKISGEKPTTKNIFLVSLISFICCIVIAFSSIAMVLIKKSAGLGNSKNPIRISTKEEFVSALKFGKRTYLIEEDIELDASEFVYKDFSGTILGNNKTISVSGEFNFPLIKNLSGTIESLNVELNNNEIRITQNFGIFAENSSGKITKCSILGSFVGKYDSNEEIFAGMFVSKNSGEIVDSEVKISATLENLNQSNAFFGGFVGVNNGTLLNCNAESGIVSADTVDLAGIACQNYGEISSSENEMTLIQTSDKEWHPNIGGITIANYGKIDECKNHAELNASSLVDDGSENRYYVFVGGIACENYGEINNARNFGRIISKGKRANIVSGGLVAQNIDNDDGLVGKINSSLVKSDVQAKSESGVVCVGGVVGLNATSVANSGFIGTIDADSNATQDQDVMLESLDKEVVVIAGGIVGLSQYSEIKNCYSDTNFIFVELEFVPEGDTSPQKCYAGIVGNVGVYAYADVFYGGPYKTNGMSNFDKNYYVEKTEISEFAYGIYATTSGGYYVNGQLVAVDDSVITAYFGENSTAFGKTKTLQEIPLEVIYE